MKRRRCQAAKSLGPLRGLLVAPWLFSGLPNLLLGCGAQHLSAAAFCSGAAVPWPGGSCSTRGRSQPSPAFLCPLPAARGLLLALACPRSEALDGAVCLISCPGLPFPNRMDKQLHHGARFFLVPDAARWRVLKLCGVGKSAGE